jgi:small subunit ribosomal protein S7
MRRRRAVKREVAPDPIYNDVLVTKLINRVEAFTKAINNVKPLLEVRPRRVGGATYQIPFEVPEDRALSLALRWIVAAARAKSGRPTSERLALELIDAYNGTGVAVKKREDVHRMAEAGKAYAHFRW